MGTKIYDNQIKDNIALTGTPTAPTPSVSDDSTRIATTEFVHNVFGEFYPTGLTPTYVDANTFTVAGDLTAIFTQGRVLKITDTGGTFNAICATSAYDAGTELTTVTVAGDTLDSGLSAVLYAVSQHTGAIWESGSNANGEYVRYADGTMMCSYTDQIGTSVNTSTSAWGPSISTYYANRSYTYPASFFSEPNVAITAIDSGSGVCSACLNSITTTTNVNIELIGSCSLAKSSYIAIGRWY